MSDVYSKSAASAEPPTERVAQLLAHRACHSAEHDPLNGKIHGYCMVCGVPWPCAYAGEPPTTPQTERLEAIRFAEDERASHVSWMTWLEHCETCGVCAASLPTTERIEHEIGNLADQREWVRRYDVILRALGATEPAPVASRIRYLCQESSPVRSAPPPPRVEEHPAIQFNRWFAVGAAGDPFFPGLYDESQLRGVCYLAFMAGRESLQPTPPAQTEDR